MLKLLLCVFLECVHIELAATSTAPTFRPQRLAIECCRVSVSWPPQVVIVGLGPFANSPSNGFSTELPHDKTWKNPDAPRIELHPVWYTCDSHHSSQTTLFYR